jgi:RNA polymerase sigma-70 factor, ECF subfamily
MTAALARVVEQPESEAQFVDELRIGLPNACDRLVREQGPRLLATARRILGNDADAHDAVQDAFVAFFRGLPSFEGSCRLSTWLQRIGINASLMRLRSRRRRPERSIEELLPTYYDDGHRIDPKDAWTPEAESNIEIRERRAIVRRCIDELPEDYRTVIVLRDLEELDTDHAAQLLGISTGAVKTRLHRARQALRTLLEREIL